ncbi:hypothetical protein AEGHOMDF_0110 [Methylobacterium soli]|nr:hypothetical protein AEGHOMDF_0110 [Methylobacterium soli]
MQADGISACMSASTLWSRVSEWQGWRWMIARAFTPAALASSTPFCHVE